MTDSFLAHKTIVAKMSALCYFFGVPVEGLMKDLGEAMYRKIEPGSGIKTHPKKPKSPQRRERRKRDCAQHAEKRSHQAGFTPPPDLSGLRLGPVSR